MIMHRHAIKRLFFFTVAVALLVPHWTSLAVDIPGVLPDAWDQPRINLLLRRTMDGDPLTSLTFAELGDDVFNIEAFLDTGASSLVLSTGESLLGLGTADDFGVQTTGAAFFDVGLAGSTEFDISEILYLNLAPYHLSADLNNRETMDSVYNRSVGPVRTQVGPIGMSNTPLLTGLDVIGMPVLFGNVGVLDPKPVDNAVELDITDILNLDPSALPIMRAYIYDPGTPFNPGWTDADPSGPGIPPSVRHVTLSYANVERYTKVVPAAAERPTSVPNPFIGPNPVPPIETGEGAPRNTINQFGDDPPGVTISFRGASGTGSFLLDTGAAASFISKALAAKLQVRYRPETTEPILEFFDPANPIAQGEDITAFVRTVTGIGGGSITLAGFYLDSLLVRTVEGNPNNDNDPNHLRYSNAPTLVHDITLQDPNTLETLTLDGIFGMNYLVASTDFDLDCFLAGTCPTRIGAFNWVVLDFSHTDFGVMGLDLKDCQEDIDRDRDVDGSDIALFLESYNTARLPSFASTFGRDNCLEQIQ